MMEFYSSSNHKARKPHKCHLCRQEIAAGEKYQHESGKYDGDTFDRRSHIRCAAIITAYLSETQEQEYDADWIVDWITDACCRSCENWDSCEGDPIRCEKILTKFGGEINE